MIQLFPDELLHADVEEGVNFSKFWTEYNETALKPHTKLVYRLFFIVVQELGLEWSQQCAQHGGFSVCVWMSGCLCV